MGLGVAPRMYTKTTCVKKRLDCVPNITILGPVFKIFGGGKGGAFIGHKYLHFGIE